MCNSRVLLSSCGQYNTMRSNDMCDRILSQCNAPYSGQALACTLLKGVIETPKGVIKTSKSNLSNSDANQRFMYQKQPSNRISYHLTKGSK